jgi:5-hydroxyisourate hydrolase-like protein (transthyretin family)
MLQRIRVAALAIALGAGALVLVPTAATAAADPVITRVEINPGPPVDVTNGAVTATFSFATKGADKAELQLKPPGDISVGKPVDLTSAKNGDWTKWTGTKSFDSSNTGTWSWLAIAGGASRGGTFEVVAKKVLDTKIVDFDASPDFVDRGDLVKVSGRLLADGKGYGAQSVAITFRARGADAYREITKVTTGADGSFSATVRARETGWWRAEFAATSGAKGSVSDADRVDVRRGDLSSRIAGFDARPEPVDKGDRLTFTGALQVEGRDGVAGERVSIFFRAGGSHRWEYVTSDVTGRDGRFWASATAQTSGWWRAEYSGTRGVRGSVSGADWVEVNQPAPAPAKADTRLIKFNAYPEPVKRGKYVKVAGKLQIDDEGSWAGYSGKVALYFKRAGSHKWEYVKTTRSSESGRLYTKVKAWNSGSWRFVFAGDEDAYGDTSRSDYVRVKR